MLKNKLEEEYIRQLIDMEELIINIPKIMIRINSHKNHKNKWRRGVMVITTAQLHSTKSELRFCADSNPARGVSKICDGENL